MDGTRVTPSSWRQSSFCGGPKRNCVQVALGGEESDMTAVRDSKNEQGGHFTVGRSAWQAFVSSLRG